MAAVVGFRGMKLTTAERAMMGKIGRKGGHARAKSLTATRRVEIARMGVEARRAKRVPFSVKDEQR
jgi:hypothetical protein